MPFAAKESLNDSSNETLEPQITSADAAERKLARRLRIKRRLSAVKKRLVDIEPEDGEGATQTKTVVEAQVASSNNLIYDAIDQGIESVTNIEVAGNAYEVKRREDEAAIREARIQQLMSEAAVAEEKFNVITAKWEKISCYNDPLDLYEETEKQKEKCKELLAMKDSVIHRLQNELKNAEHRFIKDQEKQTADINLLVSRINEQINVMKKVVRAQLSLIEMAIDSEHKELVESFSKKWESLNRQREKDQILNLEQKMANTENHHRNMETIMISHQEKYRNTKILLEMGIQQLLQEVEDLKAVCLLNKEKMDYNYQVLKKRDDENILIKSQQKRRINKLQDIATNLRRQIKQMADKSDSEIKRLRNEVTNLYNKINDIEMKSKHFSFVNEAKFREIWKFNREKVNGLIRKIMSTDSVIYDNLLGLPWVQHENYSRYLELEERVSQDLASIEGRSKLKVATDVEDKHDEKPQKSITVLPGAHKQKFVNKLLSIVADSAGFIIEDRLHELLAPYTLPQQTLVYLDNIFTALGLKNHQDVELLTEVLEPYVDCSTCSRKAAADISCDISPKVTSGGGDLLSPERPAAESGILAQITDMVVQRVNMVQNVVKEITLETEDKESEQSSTLSISDEQLSLSLDSASVSFSEMSMDTRIELPPPSRIEIIPVAKEESREASICHPQCSRDHVHSFVHQSNQEEINEVESEKFIPQLRIKCRIPEHKLTIEPLYVVKALKEFVCQMKTEEELSKLPLTLEEELADDQSKKGSTVSETMDTYWLIHKNIFTVKQEKLWDALLLGLQKYHDILEDRHTTNLELKKLKRQNRDLKRLLQNFVTSDIYEDSDMVVPEDDLICPAHVADSFMSSTSMPVQMSSLGNLF